jgi:hypothetical protein
MAETPIGYFPDAFVQFNAQLLHDHVTEVLRARNGREQRRAVLVSTGQRLFTASSDALPQSDRKIVRDFLNSRRGKLDAFYFFNPIPEKKIDVACGSVPNSSFFILPHKIISPIGIVNGVINDVRVTGVSKAFTVRSLNPRTGTFVAPRFYNASQSYIDCGTNASLRSNDFTVAFWIRPITSATAQFIVMNEVLNASGIAIFLSGGSNLTLVARTNQAGANTTSTGPTLVADTWQHVAIVKSGTSCTFYVNAVSSAGVGTLTNPVVTAAPWRMSFNSASGFDGMLSDVRYYNVAFPSGTITAIYTLGDIGGIGTSNLTGWWKLEEGTGTTVADSSGFGNTGTFGGTSANPTWVGGEAEITFTGGNQTGTVTMTGTARERLITRSDSDRIKQTFIPNTGDVRSVFDLALLELPI